MAKKHAKIVGSRKKSTNLLDKKHRPIHGMIAGGVLYLLKGVFGFLSVIGILLVLVSLLVYLLRLRDSHRKS